MRTSTNPEAQSHRLLTGSPMKDGANCFVWTRPKRVDSTGEVLNLRSNLRPQEGANP